MSDETYYIRWRGRVTGNWTKERIASLLEKGQLSKHHEVSNSSNTDWFPLKMHGDFEYLFSRSSQSRSSLEVSEQEKDSDSDKNRLNDTSLLEEGADAQDASRVKMKLKQPVVHQAAAVSDAGQKEENNTPPPPLPPGESNVHCDRWYYELNGQVLGPVPENELAAYSLSGAIKADTLVCRQGDNQWVLARSAFPGEFTAGSSSGTPSLRLQQRSITGAGSQPSGLGWYFEPIRKYADFSGRSTRREYWSFYVGNALISMALIFWGHSIEFYHDDFFPVLAFIFPVFIFLPSWAVLFRRLHDTGNSGWFWLLLFIPFVGILVIFVFTLQDGQPGWNRFGPNPREVQLQT